MLKQSHIKHSLVSMAKHLLAGAGLFVLGAIFNIAAAEQTIGDLAQNVTSSIEDLVLLAVAACYIGGTAFVGAGIMKLKQHKDNPTQVPLSTGIMMIFVGAALVWLPQIIQTAGQTVFGEAGYEEHGTAQGRDIFSSGGG